VNFIGTDLEERLRSTGTTTLVIAAFTTDHSGSTTVRMSGNLGFETWYVGDACSTYDREGPDGEIFPAELVHRTALASVHGEFADVINTDEAIKRLDARRQVSVDGPILRESLDEKLSRIVFGQDAAADRSWRPSPPRRERRPHLPAH
jgi:isochorismate hydrolase